MDCCLVSKYTTSGRSAGAFLGNRRGDEASEESGPVENMIRRPAWGRLGVRGLPDAETIGRAGRPVRLGEVALGQGHVAPEHGQVRVTHELL